MSEVPRGLRNNNPGNIRHSSIIWMGQSDEQPDKSFVHFEAPKYGIRALYKTLRTYQLKHGLKTIAAMIARWAPPSENDTGSYARAVAQACGVGVDDQVDVIGNKALTEKMVAAIIHHENGQQPFSGAEIRAAMELA
ncbi:structural protein P5 [Dongia deserti]|uniref:structural protein P5 n=1 Tax=Dongia deserti TaxID=2268030 RepID=UPI000E656E4F|nr:structural protein P5 [Dongia deserti]